MNIRKHKTNSTGFVRIKSLQSKELRMLKILPEFSIINYVVSCFQSLYCGQQKVLRKLKTRVMSIHNAVDVNRYPFGFRKQISPVNFYSCARSGTFGRILWFPIYRKPSRSRTIFFFSFHRRRIRTVLRAVDATPPWAT